MKFGIASKQLFRGNYQLNSENVQQVNSDLRHAPGYINRVYEGQFEDTEFTVSYHAGDETVPHANVFVEAKKFNTEQEQDQFFARLRSHLIR